MGTNIHLICIFVCLESMLDIHLVQPTNQTQGWKLALIHSPRQMSNLPGRVQIVNFLVIFLKSLANIASAVVMSPLRDLVP